MMREDKIQIRLFGGGGGSDLPPASRKTHQERWEGEAPHLSKWVPGAKMQFRPHKSTNFGFGLPAPFGAAPFYGYPSKPEPSQPDLSARAAASSGDQKYAPEYTRIPGTPRSRVHSGIDTVLIKF